MAMASVVSLTVCGISPCILITSNAIGPSSLHTSSRCSSFLTTLRGRKVHTTSISAPGFLSIRRKKSTYVYIVPAARSDGPEESREAVDISVFRFTLGIPGFDDSDLPRLLGILFGGLVILNHAFSLSSLTAAQLRSEGVGLLLAALSISLPTIGRQLPGTKSIQRQLEPGQKQIFSLADGLNDSQRQDVAWVSYNLLRNTSTVAMLVWHSGRVVGARGFWGDLTDSAPGPSQTLGCLQQKLGTKLDDFSNLREPLYLSANADSQGWDIFPNGTESVLVQPFPKDSNLERGDAVHGFLLLISNTAAGYRRKDRKWTLSLTKKLSETLSQ